MRVIDYSGDFIKNFLKKSLSSSNRFSGRFLFFVSGTFRARKLDLQKIDEFLNFLEFVFLSAAGFRHFSSFEESLR